MIHGANIFKYQGEGKLTDFSSNINPLGAPKIVYEIIERDLKNIERYPDIEYRRLYADLSEAFGTEKQNIAIGNGAIELIDRIISEHDRIIVFDPSFSEYEIRAKVYGKEFIHFDLKEDFSIDFERLNNFKFKEKDLLIITNPNNPNGRLLTADEHKKLIDLTNESQVNLMLDEAFIDFVDVNYNSLEFLSDKIYVIRAATKFYALPGLRLGILFSSEKNIERIRELVPSWSVGSLLENIGEIFKDEAFKNKTREYIKREREFLLSELAKFKSIKPVKSDADFILIDLGENAEEYIFEEFLKHDILVRKCSSYRNLDGNFIRIAVKSHENNLKLINALEEILNG